MGKGAERRTEIFVCTVCGGMAERLMRPRRIKPYWAMIGTFIVAILSPQGMIQLAAIATALYGLSSFGLAGVAMFIFTGYYFQVIRMAAQGSEQLPEPADFVDLFDLFLPPFRLSVATAFIWLPASIYIYKVIGFWPAFRDPAHALADPVLFLIIFLGVLYFPAAIITAAVAESTLAMLNPLITVRMIFRIPVQYLLTMIVWAVLSVTNGASMFILGRLLAFVRIPLVVPIVTTMLGMMIPIVTAFILGRLIFQNGEHFGIVRRGALEEPEVPGAEPRGFRDTRALGAASKAADSD